MPVTPARKAATRPLSSVIEGSTAPAASTNARMLVIVSRQPSRPQRHGASALPIETWPNSPAP